MSFRIISNLSIVIPTYNRQDYALRNMKFWSERGAIIYVLDGSSLAIDKERLKEIGPNVRYCHMPFSIHERLLAATNFISTPYCIMLSDDEFYIPSALEACIKELELDSDLVACNGQCVRFSMTGMQITAQIEYPRLKTHSISQELPVERIMAHMDNYVPSTIYSVVRTDVWTKAIKAATQMMVALYSFEELAFELVVSYSGKTKVINELSWLRSSEVAPVRTTDTSHEIRVSAKQWLYENKYASERYEFFKKISYTLSDEEFQIKRISKELEEAVRVFERASKPKSKISLQGKIKMFIFSFINIRLKNAIRPIIATVMKSYRQHSLIGITKELIRIGVSVDINEVYRINSLVISFHQSPKQVVKPFA